MVKVQKRLSQELDKYNPSEHQWHVNEGCKVTLSKTQPPQMQLENFMQLLHSVFHWLGFPPSVSSRGRRAAFSSDISLFPLSALFQASSALLLCLRSKMGKLFCSLFLLPPQ